MLKLLMISSLFISLTATASDLPIELDSLNGDYQIVEGDDRCDDRMSIWGYKDLSINIQRPYNFTFSEINKGKHSGGCMGLFGSKAVYNTKYKNNKITNYSSDQDIGCFAPNAFVKLEADEELTILDSDLIEIKYMMATSNPVTCIYQQL